MNEREKRFCEEYLVDLCAARAARRVGYSKTTANSQASAWIHPEHPKKPELRAEIDRMLAARTLRTQVNADRVVRELAEIAFDGDAGPEGEIAEPAPPEGEGGVPPRRARARGASAVRTQDKLRALELLGKHLGIFAENVRAEQAQPVIVDETGGADDAESEGGDA